jgi:hypothetical protein
VRSRYSRPTVYVHRGSGIGSDYHGIYNKCPVVSSRTPGGCVELEGSHLHHVGVYLRHRDVQLCAQTEHFFF